MNFAAALGCNSGRATPSLRRTPTRQITTTKNRQDSTYLKREAVQTIPTSSVNHRL
jgi:hypothetical protein